MTIWDLVPAAPYGLSIGRVASWCDAGDRVAQASWRAAREAGRLIDSEWVYPPSGGSSVRAGVEWLETYAALPAPHRSAVRGRLTEMATADKRRRDAEAARYQAMPEPTGPNIAPDDEALYSIGGSGYSKMD